MRIVYTEYMNIDYPLHGGVKKSNRFSAQLVDFDYFTTQKHPNWGNWAYDYLIKKNWATLKSLARGKNCNLPRFGPLKFWQHCINYLHELYTLFNQFLKTCPSNIIKPYTAFPLMKTTKPLFLKRTLLE